MWEFIGNIVLLYLWILWCVLPESKDVFLHNNSTIITIRNYNNDKIQLPNLSPYSNFIHSSFSHSKVQPRIVHSTQLLCSFSFLIMGQFLSLPASLMMLPLLSRGWLFWEYSSICDCPVYSHYYFHITQFWQNHHRTNVMSSVHHIRRHLLSVCPITGDVMFDLSDKVIPAFFLHCEVIVFSLVINV